jgi:hypothetical protein
MAIAQSRLSYTKRDLISLDTDIANYIKEFITRITDTSQVNPGRLLLTAIAAVVDNLNYSIDVAFLEMLLKYSRQRCNILALAEFLGYKPYSCSASSVDMTVSMITGVAPPGGQAIPIYTRFQTIATPVTDWITLSAYTIPAGQRSLAGVAAIQGTRVVAEVLTNNASGNPYQTYKLANTKTPHEFVEISVNGTVWSVVDFFDESENDDRHYSLSYDDEDYTQVTFGDNEFGAIPPAGSTITATYLYTTESNVGVAQITRIVGVLASTVSCTNQEASSGGGPSETNESIKRNAPANYRSSDRIVTREDCETHARQVSGVYDAYATGGGGARIDNYIVPVGGGIASSYLLGQCDTALRAKAMEGMLIYDYALDPASVYMAVNCVTYNNKVQKSTVLAKIRDEFLTKLYYTNIKPGRAFTLSDSTGLIENIENGELIDYCDFSIHTRIPRVEQSNPAAPAIIGRVAITDAVGYDTWVVTAVTATTFVVTKNGTAQSAVGTEGVLYTSDDSEISFTLGVLGAGLLTIGDTWRFDTSKYKDNIVIDDWEYMRLELDSDLQINIYYPGQYDLKTQLPV